MGCLKKFGKLWAFLVFALGIVLLEVGFGVKWIIFPDVLQDQIETNLKLEKGSDTWDAFVSQSLIYCNIFELLSVG